MLSILVVQLASAGPVVTGEVGGESNIGNADTSLKLGAVSVTKSSRLITFAPWAQFNNGTAAADEELEFVVYAETDTNEWDLVWSSGLVSVGDEGDFQPSRDVDLLLEVDRRYALGMYLAEGDYDYHFDTPAPNVDLGWAVFEGAIWSAEGEDLTLPNTIFGQAPDVHGYQMRITVEILDQDGDGSLEDVDCDDADPNNFPGNLELCDGLDNDCSEVPDDPVDYVQWFRDADGDGFGAVADVTEACDGSVPQGTVAEGTDCDDGDADIHPGQPEICDGIDEDCDAAIDDDPIYQEGWDDLDADGFGDPTAPHPWCEADVPAGIVENDLDCDDTSALSNPLGVEVCDGLNNDCDLLIDEDFTVVTFWADADGDGAGDKYTPITACDTPPGAVDNLLDCDDTDAERFPANAEVCDGKDNNCDGLAGGEGDFDGDGSIDCEDCLSDDPTSYPGAPEDTCDGVDHDCDGVIPDPEACEEAEGDDKEGCGCATGPAFGLAPLLAVALFLRRRRGAPRAT